ncbi:MAG: hypothetical protein HKN68_04245 [Saprospiraceae bacterium]|nr:hypothetical protein [Saprospiraceae bacterium]
MSKDRKQIEEQMDRFFWLTLRMVIRGISILSLVIVFGLIFMLAEDHISEMWNNFTHSIEVKSQPLKQYEKSETREVVNGIHQETGLAYGVGFSTVKKVCLSCHSSALITQNKATAEGWDQMLTWMQKTQGLPALGKDRKVIVDYLSKNYGPVDTGRRPNLPVEEIEWYVLELE